MTRRRRSAHAPLEQRISSHIRPGLCTRSKQSLLALACTHTQDLFQAQTCMFKDMCGASFTSLCVPEMEADVEDASAWNQVWPCTCAEQ